MTRRERHIRIIESWGEYSQAGQFYRQQLINRRGLKAFNDAAIEELARSLVDSEFFDGLTAVVQYRGKDGISPHKWRTMAAFDSKSMADDYARNCANAGNRPWEYRSVEVTP